MSDKLTALEAVAQAAENVNVYIKAGYQVPDMSGILLTQALRNLKALPPPSQQAPGKDGLLPMTPERLEGLRDAAIEYGQLGLPAVRELLDEIQRLTRPSAAQPSPEEAVGKAKDAYKKIALTMMGHFCRLNGDILCGQDTSWADAAYKEEHAKLAALKELPKAPRAPKP